MDNGADSYRRFIDGDDNGIVEIIRDYKDGLVLYINSFTEDIGLAEEYMEDTFFRLVTKKPKYSGKSSFKTWLYAIGRNVAIDNLRKRRRARYASETERKAYSTEENAEQLYIREESKLILHRAIYSLNPDYRQVLFLIFFEGFTNSETAHVMRKTNRQIENLVYRAKKALRAELEKEGFEYENV